MKLGAAARILIVTALSILGLIGLVVSEGLARQSGQEILLRMEAVDPRSLLSGHYVVMNLTERLDAGEQCPPGAEGEWLAFRADEGEIYALAAGAETRDAARQIAPVALRGAFTCNAPIESPGAEPFPGWVQLDIGVDRFHIDQTEAMRIESVLRAQTPDAAPRAYAIVSVGNDGRARLKGLMIDGERLELNWR